MGRKTGEEIDKNDAESNIKDKHSLFVYLIFICDIMFRLRQYSFHVKWSVSFEIHYRR